MYRSLIAILGIVALISCSKKDVVQDEPLINPSDATPAPSDGATLAPQTPVGTEGAGNADATDLEIVHFAYDSYTLTDTAKGILKKHAAWLSSHSGATVQVEGHCDERGTTEYNIALGERRANTARDYLVKLGVARNRLSTVSYGEERPLDTASNEAAWATNRRAAFVVLSH